MATSKMIILWWLFIISQFSFDFVAPNIMTKQKGKIYQGIGATDEAFEYENTRNDFKCCNYQEKWKTKCQTTAISIPGTQGAFSNEVAPDINGFTDELIWYSSLKKILS